MKKGTFRIPGSKPSAGTGRVENRNVPFLTRFPLPHLLILLAIFAVYSGTLSYGLVGFDDDLLVVNNRPFLDKLSNLSTAFGTDAFINLRARVFYRPLQTVSFMLDLAVRPEGHSIFHLSNVILHCLTCIALFHLLCLLRYDRLLSLIGALIYAVHPLFGMAVSWIPGRGDLLLGFFAVSASIFIIKFFHEPKLQYLAGHYGLFLAALFAKETAVALPVIALGYLVLVFPKRAGQRSPTNLLGVVAGWGVILAVWLILRQRAVPMEDGLVEHGLAAIWQGLAAIPELVGRFLFPAQMALIPRFTLFGTAVGLTALGALALLAIVQRQSIFPRGVMGPLWFLAFFVPSMAYRHPLGDSAYSYLNHRAYLPMMGILMLVLSLIPAEWRERRIRALVAAGVTLMVLLGLVSFLQSKNFADPIAFYNAAVERNPASALAYNNRGRVLMERGNFLQGRDDFNRALELYPAYPDALCNRAFARNAQKDYAGALSDLAEALRLQPGFAAAHSHLGIVRANLDDVPGALASFNRAIELDAGFVDAYLNRALLRLKSSDYRGAIDDYSAALARVPQNSNAYFGRASAYFNLEDLGHACSDWQEAARLGDRDAAGNYHEACGNSHLQ